MPFVTRAWQAWPIGYVDFIPVTSAALDPSDGDNGC
jgi:hypothetical protein